MAQALGQKGTIQQSGPSNRPTGPPQSSRPPQSPADIERPFYKLPEKLAEDVEAIARSFEDPRTVISPEFEPSPESSNSISTGTGPAALDKDIVAPGEPWLEPKLWTLVHLSLIAKMP